ncbi:MAG TPA: hemolysin family protein [Dehalococcoidia bacterium]
MDTEHSAALLILAVTGVLLLVVAAAEASIISISRARVRALAGRQVPGAERLQRYVRERQVLASSLAIARTLITSTASVLVAYLILDAYGFSWGALVFAVVLVIIGLSLFQAVPRFVISQHPERWGLLLAPLMGPVRLVFGPVAWAFELPGRLLVRLRPGGAEEAEREAEEEELVRLVEMEEENGGIEEEERQMIRGVISLVDTTAREIMVPRIDIVALEAKEPFEHAVRVIVERGLSRIPLYQDSIDNIIGIVYAKDVLAYLANGRRPEPLTDIARPPYFIPESKKVDELLTELRQNRIHIAIVVDEYGGTAGLVTIEDLIEEIVGEIEDEYDVEEVAIEQLTETEAILDARVSIDALNERFHLNIESEDFDTVGGLIYHSLGKMPVVGDEIQVDGLRLRVLSVVGRRIKKVRVTKEAAPAEPAADERRA